MEALDALVERYRAPLFGFIVNMTRNPGEADEVFQEVWLKAIRKLGMFRNRNLGGWLMRIAHNAVIDRVRRRKPEVSLDQEHDGGGSLADILAGSDRGASEAVADRDLGRRIRAAVADLPHHQREVFLMRTQMDLAFKEIARIQGTSINTALARMQYALNKLRERLATDYTELTAGSRPATAPTCAGAV
ncbi:sigma-70 family RNA polymerase sigma factor [Verrucomicrobiota bacterium]